MTEYDFAAARRLEDPEAWKAAGLADTGLAAAWWEAGFDPDEAAEWLPVVRNAFEYQEAPLCDDDLAQLAVARTFKAARFTVREAEEWQGALLNWAFGRPLEAVHEARRWRAAGFDANLMGVWRNPPVYGDQASLELAVAMHAAGWWPGHCFALVLFARRSHQEDWEETARAWAELGPPQVLDYARAGMTPSEAAVFDRLGLHPDALRIELQARYESAPPIDPYLAMHFNHDLYGDFVDEEEEDRPFWARHIRDLHDEDSDHHVTPAAEVEVPAAEERRRVQDERQQALKAMLGDDGLCRDSGGPGAMDEIRGSDEWYVRCETCGAKWAGGSASVLPDHTPVGYRP